LEVFELAYKRIALVCSFGLSTSLLVQAMERAATAAQAKVDIFAIGTSELAERAETTDVFLLAPQVRYMRPTVEKYGKPVGVVDGMIYATADGAKALRQALSLFQEEGMQ
jgi:PTS system cellobiose-specific IIB component